LDLLHVSTRVESSSGRELKEQIYFLDIEYGFFFCVSCGGQIVLFFHFTVFDSVGW
jgi:hypothetical protein